MKITAAGDEPGGTYPLLLFLAVIATPGILPRMLCTIRASDDRFSEIFRGQQSKLTSPVFEIVSNDMDDDTFFLNAAAHEH